MLHRPGLELQRLTPGTARELLFDGVLWVGRAREEHDAFAVALSSRGVEILDLDLLGPTLGPEVREWLMALASPDLAQHLVAGVTFDELPFTSDSIVARMGRGYVAAPLPNTLFMRDTSAWIYGGVSVNTMAMPARVRESLHL